MSLSEVNNRPGSLIVHMESMQYCLKEVTIRNGTATARTLSRMTGYPLKAGTNGADYNLAVDGDEANVTALLVAGPPGDNSIAIGATTTSSHKFTALVHPPAVINKDMIATEDIAGAAFDVDAIETALEALDYEVRSEPEKSSTL